MNGSGMLSAMGALIKRDVVLAYRCRAELANPVLFFAVITVLFPLSASPDEETLKLLGPGVLWVAALLSTVLSLGPLFRSDFDDGALEQMLMSPHPLPALIVAKVFAHWLVTGLPLIAMSPALALLLNLPPQALPVLLSSLALGTPVLSFVGAIGIALTVGLRNGGMLLALLVLPLYVPVLIFGAGAVHAAVFQLDASGQLFLLGALLALAATLAPWAIAAALTLISG
ncbi:MAG: heme exporter protein CcmB [Gammaproteobacteria bacterium]